LSTPGFFINEERNARLNALQIFQTLSYFPYAICPTSLKWTSTGVNGLFIIDRLTQQVMALAEKAYYPQKFFIFFLTTDLLCVLIYKEVSRQST